MLALPPWWWRRTWEKEGGGRVDGECEIAITMLPSQAEMRWAQFAFANGRMPTFRLRLKLPGFPTIFLGFSYIFYIFFFLFFVFSTSKIRPKIFS